MFTLLKILFELMFMPLKIMMWAVKKVFWILLIGIGFFIQSEDNEYAAKNMVLDTEKENM